MMFIKGLFIYWASILLAQQAAGDLFGSSDKEIIDKEPLNGLTTFKVLLKLCSDPNSRISRVSSIKWLVKQFDNLKDESLTRCKDRYLEPLWALNKVIVTKPDDVCSMDQFKLIDEFHWDYQMGAMSKKWTKFGQSPLPEALKVFFLHYVSEITRVCKANLPENLGLAVAQKDTSQDEAVAQEGNFNRVVDTLQKMFISVDKIKHHDNFVLIWDMMINNERKNKKDIVFEDPVSKEKLVALVRVKEAANYWIVQQRCRQILRPVYRNSVLPVMKLIDLGYDQRDKQLDEELDLNKELKNWYILTQICEMLMPMKFYEDPKRKFWESGLMQTFSEASKYKEEMITHENLVELSRVKVRAISLPDELNSALTSDDTKLLKSVKSNVKARGRLYRAAISMILVYIKTLVSHQVGGYKQVVNLLKKFRHSDKRKERIEDDEMAEDIIKEADESSKDERLDKGLQQQPKEITRSKRAIVLTTGQKAGIVIVLMALALFFAFRFGLPLLAG